MSTFLNPVIYVIGVAGMFLLLIAPHEAGHFLFAKLFKVRVIEFSIGAGTKLWSFTRNGTVYAIRLLPILGYVRMGGMEADDFKDPDGFHTRSAWQKIVILAGGPAANFLVAMLIITGFQLTQINSVPGKVVDVVAGSPAASAGFRAGDSIQTVNGKAVSSPDEMRKQEDAAPGAPLTVGGVHSNGQRFEYVVTPGCSQGACQVGVRIQPLLSAGAAISYGVTWPFQAVSGIVQGLWSLISGQVPGGLLGPQGLTGPIGIGAVTYSAVSQGPPSYLFLVALLSVALGFTNLLPLLALDGGRIVVVVLEWLRRRPFDRTTELNFQRWGLVALLAVAAVISFLDIQRIASGQFPGLH
ncbi:MAG TPA: M50 family metallopeptidase [Candidatus Dormibacteraeota bacterium]|nr:M50 family metallopeptidase [Candidatus Dormibacteraeota bacterium]